MGRVRNRVRRGCRPTNCCRRPPGASTAAPCSCPAPLAPWPQHPPCPQHCLSAPLPPVMAPVPAATLCRRRFDVPAPATRSA